MRSVYRELSEDEKIKINNIKAYAQHLYDYLDSRPISPIREINVARDKLIEAVMWAVKGLSA